MPPQVSVVIPTHDRPAEFAIALDSVLSQEGVDLEVVTVDDGSRDATTVGEVVQRASDSRIALHRHDRPRGVSAARNTGISAATGQWLAFLDDDDVWAPDKLRAQLSAACDRGRCWAYAGQVSVDDRLRVVGGTPPPSSDDVVRLLQRANAVPAGSSNVIVERSVVARVGTFDPALLSGADWDLWLRLSAHGPPAVARAPLVAYRIHGGRMTRDRQRMLRDAAMIAARHDLDIDWPAHHRWAAWDSLIDGRRLEAVGHYARAARRGDLGAVPRAFVGLLAPWVGRTTLYRRHVNDPVAAEWARGAESWLVRYRSMDR